MGLIKAKCTECGSPLQVQEGSKKAKCPHCGSIFLVEDAVNNYVYNTTNNIKADVLNVINQKEDFVIEGCVLIRYQGQSDVVTIPEGVKKIGEKAFFKSGVAKIICPDSLKVIGVEAFANCEFLEEIVLNKVEKIEERAFDQSGLKSIEFPPTLKEVGTGAFSQCHYLKSIKSDYDSVYLGACVFAGDRIEKLALTINDCDKIAFYNFDCDELTLYGNCCSYCINTPTNLIVRTNRIKDIYTYEEKDRTQCNILIGKEVNEIESISRGDDMEISMPIDVEDADKFISALLRVKGHCYANILCNGKHVSKFEFVEDYKYEEGDGPFMSSHYHRYNRSRDTIYINQNIGGRCAGCGHKYDDIKSKLTHTCNYCLVKTVYKKNL